jgi:hypothetical protein
MDDGTMQIFGFSTNHQQNLLEIIPNYKIIIFWAGFTTREFFVQFLLLG